MLCKIAPSRSDFHALADYLLHGKSKQNTDPKRVAWVAAQNLPTDDPLLAAQYMAATAAQSTRIKKAAYHLMIAWHQREFPTPEAMQEIARQTLALAGLEQHQALIMGHGDRPHPHLHIMLNRVHPETGRVWSTAHDYRRFDAIMRQLSDAHGFLFIPAHAYNRELTDDQPSGPTSPAAYAAKRGANTRRLKWSRASARHLGMDLSEDLTPASTMEDIAVALADRGLRLERKGQGLIAGNDQSYATFSSLGLTMTAASKQRVPHIFRVDGVDIARALAKLGLIDRAAVRKSVDAVMRDREDQQRLQSLSGQMAVELRRRLSASTAIAPQAPHSRAQRNRMKTSRAMTR